MTPHTMVLDGTGVGPLIAGGKGSALDKLAALNTRIPATGVITTAAYEAFEAVPEIASFVADLKTAEIPDPTRHDDHRKLVDEMFLSIPLPGEVAASVDELARVVSDGHQVAVRSSATAEDLESASFAGQYESYLNVDAAAVHDAVRLVWASLWYPAPRAYRRFRQIDEHDLTMAVVVMRMLDPSEAGVLFTVDPGGGDDAVRLEVVQGLGEQLVSGEKTPDAYVIERETMVDEFASISPPLRDLATEALRLEEALGAPQDIEFAVHDGELYLVQARPITTVVDASRTDDGFDFSCGDQTTYTTAGIAETMPGVLSPLSWSINSWLLENGFRNLFDLLGGGADVLTHEHALIGRFRGRAALNLDAMSDAAASIPGGSPDELQRQYFGEAVPREDGDSPQTAPLSRSAGAAQGVRVLRARRSAVEESEVVIQAVNNLMEDEPGLVRMSDTELFAYWNRLMHLGQRVAAAEVAVAAMASAAHRSVEVFLERHMSTSEAAASARTLTSIEGAERRSRIALALDDVTERIRNDDELRSMAVEDWETTRDALEGTVPGRRVVLDFMEAMRRAGSTGIFAGPTWDEVPNLAWLTVFTELESPPEQSGAAERRGDALDALEDKLTSTSKWKWTRFVTGQLMDVRRRFLRREAADAAELLHRRELTKAALLIIGGVVRHANIEIGVRLHERGILETPEDVEMLSIGELRALVGAEAPTHETIAQRRRRNLEAAQAEPLPLVWTGEPPQASAAEITGEHVEGWSASPGRYEGRARIVDSPATSELRRGEVLVATTTDASWAPLFMAAGAVVVEQGGPLSHAAIVARELGMPAVANVPGLIARLRQEGEAPLVTVDGTEGVVVIHSGDDGDEEIDLTGSPSAPDSVAAGMAPVRTTDERWDDSGSGFNVFVAGLMGAGALMSILMGLTESISSIRGRERLQRQAAPKALMMSEGTIHGYEHVLARATGLRPRRDYLLASIVLFGVAAALLATSLDSYLSEASGSVVAFALSATGVATLAAIGATSLVAARNWPEVPPIVRRLAPGRPARQHSVWASVSVPARRSIYAMLALVAVGGLLAIVAESWLLEIDEPIYFDWLEAREDADRWGPGWLNNLGQPIVIIPLSVAIGLATLRCRIVALAWPAAIIGGGLANLVLSWVVHRQRPPFSAHAGEFTSYPGGHSIQLTLLMGMLPLAVDVVTDSRLAGRITGVLAAGIWFVAWADTVRTGGHWPIDQLAGLLIAISLLTVVYSAANRERQHDSCEDCRHRVDHTHRH